MKITFFGTAADSSYPLAFCRCDYCNKARELGGKDFRKRSSVVINDDLLIDLGPDIVSASFMYNKSIADIRYCLQTHSHSDHFDASHLSTRIPEYMGVNTPFLEIYGSEATLKKMSETLKSLGYGSDLFNQKEKERMNVEVFPVRSLQFFEVGKYKVTAFSANYDKSVDPLLYAITEDNCTVFYGVDTDTFPEETWNGFHEKKLKFNMVILDHTYGPNADNGSHLNANRFIGHIKRMKEENLLEKNARIFATHISHEGNPNHNELVSYAKEHGYEIAYDGLVI